MTVETNIFMSSSIISNLMIFEMFIVNIKIGDLVGDFTKKIGD